MHKSGKFKLSVSVYVCVCVFVVTKHHIILQCLLASLAHINVCVCVCVCVYLLHDSRIQFRLDLIRLGAISCYTKLDSVLYACVYLVCRNICESKCVQKLTVFQRVYVVFKALISYNRFSTIESSVCVCLTSFSFIVTVCSRRCNRLTAFEMAPLSFVRAFVLLARSVKWILSLNCQKSGDSMDERIRKIAGENDGKRINERE